MKIQFQNQQVVEISSANSRALVAPDYGARLLTWEVAGQSIIYWPDNADWTNPSTIAHTRGGNPILFPFIARHYAGGVLGQWQDQSGVIRTLPMHGFARELEFEVVDEKNQEDEQSVRMRLCSTEETRAMYPFDFQFDVVYRVGESTLEATFETTNTGEIALPYYPGHHFYFAIPSDARSQWQIHLPCRTWGHQNPDGSVRFEDAENTATTLADESLIDRFHLDFLEPQVTLQNQQSASNIKISWDETQSEFWRYITTWTQTEQSDFYCVEPWLGLPNAIHHNQGLCWLEPGKTESATCCLSVS